MFGERSWALIRPAPPASLSRDAGRAEIIVVLLFKNEVESFAVLT